MDLSNPPKDVLGLGKHLVRELDFEDGVDTLGRWMAHHLAELMHEAEKGKTVAKRTKAKKQATETILKIWEHRKVLQRESYPLSKYEDLLKIIDRLRLDSNPYRYFGNDMTQTDKIATVLFDNLTRLILGLLLIKLDSIERSKKVDDEVIEALDGEEKRIWFAIEDWYSIFLKEDDENKLEVENEKNSEVKEIDFRKNSIELIDNIRSSLTKLRKELSKKNFQNK